MKKLFAVILLCALSLALMAVALMQPPFESLEAFLIWLAFGGGATVLVGLLFTLIVYQFAFWHRLPYWAQVFLPMLVAAFLGTVAQVVLELELYTQLSPTVGAALLAFINYLAMQLATNTPVARRLAARATNKPQG